MDPRLEPIATALIDTAALVEKVAQRLRDAAERLKPCVPRPEMWTRFDELVPLVIQDAATAQDHYELMLGTVEKMIEVSLPQ